MITFFYSYSHFYQPENQRSKYIEHSFHRMLLPFSTSNHRFSTQAKVLSINNLHEILSLFQA